MKILSCFDGISACQQAFKNLGIEFDGVNNVYYSSEIDKYAIQVTQKNFPNTKQLGDIKDLFTKQTKNELQNLNRDFNYNLSFSNYLNNLDKIHKETTIDLLVAGFPCQSFSIAGNRKGFDDKRGNLFFELLRIINEVKPKYYLLENVNSMSKENKKIICEKLGIDFTMINSSLLTAQQRKRIYFVGKLQQDGTYKKVEITQPQDKGILLKDILEMDVDEKFYLSDKMIKYITLSGSKNYKISNAQFNPEKAYPLTRTMASCHRLGIDTYIKDDICIRKLTPTECEKLQGFPINYTESIANTNRYKALGNSFTVPVIEHILKAILYETK